ncbi:acyltransferase domain-containing protein [Lactobacillus sp. ESL0677]|uniref:acyltransferase domain-containing protein n=1 Tax=Lactobacillus sp. ESL0677 TaxID=2983208 RepID=UPI0023F6B86E|nr:acyltransferase domain-containing protein [Lactobacillus sp. ESL0677]WEV36375.1 acyltransferase domain-containing protein [Lactobacillus sp. ESL0677]
MRALWLFPGQGSQFAGMLAHVTPELKEHVEQLLGLKLVDTAEGYHDTVQLQVSIALIQVDQINQLFAAGNKPDLVAGHSLGAFAAAYAAGSIKQDDLFRVVNHRASLMQNAYPNGYGMGVVVGLTRRQLAPLVAQINSPVSPVFLSNQNAANQTCISGKLTAIDQVLQLAKQNGAVIAKRLRVPVPSHSPLMQQVAEQLEQEFAQIRIAKPHCRYLTNYSGRSVRQAKFVATDLINNLIYPVYFEDMINVARDYQPEVIVNFAPGTPFKTILHQTFGDLRQINLNQASVADAIYLLNKWKKR